MSKVQPAINEKFSTAFDFISFTNKSLFLTGKAGTGKTTFLKYVKENSTKSLVVVAPTGVAAINAGGVTIHSLFQLPPTPFLPTVHNDYVGQCGALNLNYFISNLKINKDKIAVFKSLELLIIDEVSMVRADVLDMIDAVLKHYRRSPLLPFGGVQVLLIGDIFQLPPVVKPDEWQVLKNYYNTMYFFSSKVFADAQTVCIELDKVYRQSDEKFIDILNSIRTGNISAQQLDMLNKACFAPSSTTNFNHIVLTTHNAKADAINGQALNAIHHQPISYKAIIDGDFSQKAFPADEVLTLKQGAQVMFIKNDMDREKRFFNGKIATITQLDENSITVETNDDNTCIEVPLYTWENIKYKMNEETQKVEEEIIGSFKQFPLRPAWAITIHKSQGLTFSNVTIDASQAFAPGQVYVALSRCRSLQGITLSSPLFLNNFPSDHQIVQFSKSVANAEPYKELSHHKMQYILQLVKKMFDFVPLIYLHDALAKNILSYTSSYSLNSMKVIDDMGENLKNCQEVATKFIQQISANEQVQQNIIVNNTWLQQRVQQAIAYFVPKLKQLLETIENTGIATSNKAYAKETKYDLQTLYAQIFLQQYVMQQNANGFNFDSLALSKYNVKPPYINIDLYLPESLKNEKLILCKHVGLYKKLYDSRAKLAVKESVTTDEVCTNAALLQVANNLPTSLLDLLNTQGISNALQYKIAETFLKHIYAYCIKENLFEANQPWYIAMQNKMSVSAFIAYELFNTGCSIANIASQRKLAESTTEGHLLQALQFGLLTWQQVVSQAKAKVINKEINKQIEDDNALTIAERLVQKNITVFEVRVMLHQIKKQ